MNQELTPNWKVCWTGTRDTWSTAGTFASRREADRCVSQLRRAYPNAEFRVEYIGRGLSYDAPINKRNGRF